MIKLSRLFILLINMLPIYTQNLVNVEIDKAVTETEILLLIEDRQDKSCMVKVLSKYLNEYNIEEEYELYIKIISIELTKCLFESDFNMPRLNLQYCYTNNWNKENVGKCIGSFTENTIIWTTFNGYLNSIDEIYNRHYLKVNNFKILEDYKDIVNELNRFIKDIIEDGDNKVRKMENELDRLQNGFEGIVKEIKENIELERELHHHYYEQMKQEEEQKVTKMSDSFISYKRINIIVTAVLGLGIVSGFMVLFPNISGILCGAEVAILQRCAAFLFGAVILKTGERLFCMWCGPGNGG